MWECVRPGEWRWRDYTARRIHRCGWDLRWRDNSLHSGVRSLEDCKNLAQTHADSQVPIDINKYPLAGVTRVEVIDHRAGTKYWGRAFSAREVRRAELVFQDGNRTMKVFLT